MKKKSLIIAVYLIVCTVIFCGCFELMEGEDEAYLAIFNGDTVHYYLEGEDFSDIKDKKINFDVYLGDTETFGADEVSGYEPQPYSYVFVSVKEACILDEVAIYAKWDKSKSGDEAKSVLGVQFFTVSKDFNLTRDFLKDSMKAIKENEKLENPLDLPNSFYKTKNDGILTLRDGEWNDGIVLDLKHLSLEKDDMVVIKLVENADFVAETSEDDSDLVTYKRNLDNDVSIKLDKILFRVSPNE